MRLLILSSEFPPGPGGIGYHAYSLGAASPKAGLGRDRTIARDVVGKCARDTQRPESVLETCGKDVRERTTPRAVDLRTEEAARQG